MWVLNFFSPFVSVRLCFIFSLLLFTSFNFVVKYNIQPIREIFMKTQRFFKRESTYSVKWIFHGSSESKFIKLKYRRYPQIHWLCDFLEIYFFSIREMCVSHFFLTVCSQPTAPIFHGIAKFYCKVGLNKHIYSSAQTTVTRPMTALMSMISISYTVLVLTRSINLLINIAFTVWRISVTTFKHENNIVDNGRHT